MTEDPSRPPNYKDLDLSTRAIADAALRRGMSVEILDAGIGEIAVLRRSPRSLSGFRAGQVILIPHGGKLKVTTC